MLTDIIKVSQLSFVKFCFGIKKATKGVEEKSEETFKKLRETVRREKFHVKARRVQNDVHQNNAKELVESDSSNEE